MRFYVVGITQEDIDDTRLVPEKKMLNDLKQIAKRGGDLEFINSDGATPVSIITTQWIWSIFILGHDLYLYTASVLAVIKE